MNATACSFCGRDERIEVRAVRIAHKIFRELEADRHVSATCDVAA
jgi:hypothetical protein